jgi:hypothetical protein
MRKNICLLSLCTFFFFSCKKEENTLPAPTDPCLNVNIVLSVTPSVATPCVSPADGSISLSASGSTGFTYKLNNGIYQTSGNFSGLSAGSYSVTAKDVNGCTKSQSVTIGAAPAGTNFTNVKNIISSNCSACHFNGNTDDFDNDCNIVNRWDRINIRCVTLGDMPPVPPGNPLTAAQKSQITAWVNAGHRYTD